jgi:hypothetical protein
VKAISCAAARRRLNAFHDNELSLGQQVEVGAHLEWCDECAGIFAELQQLRLALRSATPGRVAFVAAGDLGFHAGVVARAQAERTTSFAVRVREMFEDMHFVYPGLGAVAAIVVCVAVMLGTMRLATTEHPDSLTSTMSRLAGSGSELAPIVPPARMLLPRALDDMLFVPTEALEVDETAFTFSGVVTREGQMVNVELHPEGGQAPPAGSSEAKELEHLWGAVARARFEPARIAGLPVAANMVWLVTQTTVHAKSGFNLPGGPPNVKKRRVAGPGPSAAHATAT